MIVQFCACCCCSRREHYEPEAEAQFIKKDGGLGATPFGADGRRQHRGGGGGGGCSTFAKVLIVLLTLGTVGVCGWGMAASIEYTNDQITNFWALVDSVDSRVRAAPRPRGRLPCAAPLRVRLPTPPSAPCRFPTPRPRSPPCRAASATSRPPSTPSTPTKQVRPACLPAHTGPTPTPAADPPPRLSLAASCRPRRAELQPILGVLGATGAALASSLDASSQASAAPSARPAPPWTRASPPSTATWQG